MTMDTTSPFYQALGPPQLPGSQLPPGLPPGSKPLEGYAGYWITPFGEVGYVTDKTTTDDYGNPVKAGSFVKIPKGNIPGADAASAWHGFAPQEFQDPRYWDLQYNKLFQDARNSGLDAESARQQALAGLIANRNNTATQVAQTSADVAKTVAEFAAHPQDTYAEALYRNQVGGATPFGDINNQAFGQYGKDLAQKAQDIFQPVTQDLNLARNYARSIPQPEFFGPETRRSLGLQPTAAQALTGAAPLPAGAAPAPPANPLAALAGATPEQLAYYRQVEGNRQLASANPEQTAAIQQIAKTRGYAMGGQIDFGNANRFGGYQPPSSEGGTNMNIHEPAILIGLHSGHPYATVAENGFPEQVKITPTASGKKAAQEAQKAKDEGTKAFAMGGSVTASPSLDEMNKQYQMLLQRPGGAGGGTSTPFGGARFLAGAPANAIAQDPYLKGITEASYGIRGVSPEELWAQVQQYTPQGIQNNIPRVNFA